MNFTHSSGFHVAICPDNSPKDSERVLDFPTVKQTKGSGNKVPYPDLCPRLPGVGGGGGGKQTIRTLFLISSPYELLLKSKSRFLIRKLIFRLFTKYSSNLKRSEVRILWIISETGDTLEPMNQSISIRGMP